MPILASEALLYENKKVQWKMLPSVRIESGPLITSESKSNTILSGTDLACAIQEIFKLLFMHHLILDNEPKVSVLEANVNLGLQRRVLDLESEVHDWPGFYLLLGSNFFHWIFFVFSRSKASANINIIAILVHFEKL